MWANWGQVTHRSAGRALRSLGGPVRRQLGSLACPEEPVPHAVTIRFRRPPHFVLYFTHFSPFFSFFAHYQAVPSWPRGHGQLGDRCDKCLFRSSAVLLCTLSFWISGSLIILWPLASPFSSVYARTVWSLARTPSCLGICDVEYNLRLGYPSPTYNVVFYCGRCSFPQQSLRQIFPPSYRTSHPNINDRQGRRAHRPITAQDGAQEQVWFWFRQSAGSYTCRASCSSLQQGISAHLTNAPNPGAAHSCSAARTPVASWERLAVIRRCLGLCADSPPKIPQTDRCDLVLLHHTVCAASFFFLCRRVQILSYYSGYCRPPAPALLWRRFLLQAMLQPGLHATARAISSLIVLEVKSSGHTLLSLCFIAPVVTSRLFSGPTYLISIHQTRQTRKAKSDHAHIVGGTYLMLSPYPMAPVSSSVLTDLGTATFVPHFRSLVHTRYPYTILNATIQTLSSRPFRLAVADLPQRPVLKLFPSPCQVSNRPVASSACFLGCQYVPPLNSKACMLPVPPVNSFSPPFSYKAPPPPVAFKRAFPFSFPGSP